MHKDTGNFSVRLSQIFFSASQTKKRSENFRIKKVSFVSAEVTNIISEKRFTHIMFTAQFTLMIITTG